MNVCEYTLMLRPNIPIEANSCVTPHSKGDDNSKYRVQSRVCWIGHCMGIWILNRDNGYKHGIELSSHTLRVIMHNQGTGMKKEDNTSHNLGNFCSSSIKMYKRNGIVRNFMPCLKSKLDLIIYTFLNANQSQTIIPKQDNKKYVFIYHICCKIMFSFNVIV